MGLLFSDYIKRSKKIQGKRVTVFLTDKEWNINSCVKKLEEVIRSNQNLSFLYEFHQRYSEDEIKSLGANLVFENFLKAVEYFISYIPFDRLNIYIKICPIRWASAAYFPDISRDNLAFFQVSPYLLMREMYSQYFKNTPHKIELPSDIYGSEPLEDIIRHEFAHYLDDKKSKEKDKIWLRLRSHHPTLLEGFTFLSNLRSEGLAEFLRTKNKELFEYKIDLIKNTIESIKKYAIVVYERECGRCMYYFIGLAYLFRKDRSRFNEMKVYFDKDNFRFFAEGIGNILTKYKVIYLQNLDEDFIMAISKEMLECGHLRFLREYESACYTLGIPQDQILVTFSDYNRIKKIQYKKWLSEVEKKGFKISGLMKYVQRLFGLIRKS